MNLFEKLGFIFDQTEIMVPILTISVTWWKDSQVRNERKKGKRKRERKQREREKGKKKQRVISLSFATFRPFPVSVVTFAGKYN